MFSFSDDIFMHILESKNLSIKDNRFFDNLNKTRKNLIIGKNAAGKTRLLQTIEEYCRNKEEKGSKDFILFLLYCTKIDINIPDSKDEGNKETSNEDIVMGITSREKPSNGILTINRETLLYLLQSIPERTIPESKRILSRINDDMQDLLDKEFQIREDGNKRELLITRNTSNGKTPMPILEEWNQLSPGERIIIFIFLLLLSYLQQMQAIISNGNKEIIILLDEPEVHLHPEVILNLIVKKLFRYFSEEFEENLNGHLFIASHSVFLIPYFSFEEQIYLKNNCIWKKDSSLYKNLYGDLIGLGSEINQTGGNLFDFLASVYSWEYASFIAECFIKPIQVDNVTSTDVQFVALNEIIQEKIKKNGSIIILDYGCGEVARIGQCLVEKYGEEKRKDILKEQIKYFAYDICEINGNKVNNQNIPCLIKVIKNQNELIAEKETFDIIFLFNVLHEIDILHWEEQINILLAMLKGDGCLVSCERRVLTKGEEPYGSSGYLVYSAKELKKLFNSSNVQEFESQDNDLLNTTIITKDQNLRDVTNASIIESLEELKKNTKEKIDSCLRKDEKLSARNYAFYCQQYFNADHAITLLKTKSQDIYSSDDKFPSDIADWNNPELMVVQPPELRKLYFDERDKRKNLKGELT